MITVVAAVLAALAFYLYGTRTFKYWEKRGIKHDKPVFLFGNNKDVYLMRKSVTEVAVETYWKYPNEKVVGFFRSTRPELVIRHPEIIKRILITDFVHFYGRGLHPHKSRIEVLLRNLFFADGDLWRLLRQRMSSTFTSGKLRAMFPLIVERAERLTARAALAPSPVDARDLMARYTTDFIGACGFGLEGDALSDDDSEFRKLGQLIFNVRFIDGVVMMLKEIFPVLCQHLNYMSRAERPMLELVSAILKQRNHQPSGRHDFIDLLLECQKKGAMEGESLEKLNSTEPVQMELTDELIAAQVFVFFAAGFETSSSATSFTLHQLAFHPEVQCKVQAEVDVVLARYDGQLCYDAVKEMKYLEWTFKEGMRMFPSLGFLIRECARMYTLPELGITLDEGVGIVIPVQALHNDPEFFPEPEQFRPERFAPGAFPEIHKYAYLPFGDGPRACIGERLGLMQSLAGLAAVLSKFTVSPAATTRRHPRVEPKASIVQCIQGGLPLTFTPRDTAAT